MKLIKTGSYILWVDKNKKPQDNELHYSERWNCLHSHAFRNIEDSCYSIVAHLPLNNAPLLEGVDLLPKLPTKKQIQKDVTYNYNKYGQATAFDIANSYRVSYGYCKPCETNSPQIDGNCLICGSSVELPKQGDDVDNDMIDRVYKMFTDQVTINLKYFKSKLKMLWIEGYKANTNKYSEEDMEAAVTFGITLERFKNNKHKLSDKEEFKGFLELLHTTVLPTEFIPEMENINPMTHGNLIGIKKTKTIKVTIQGKEVNQICGIYK